MEKYIIYINIALLLFGNLVNAKNQYPRSGDEKVKVLESMTNDGSNVLLDKTAPNLIYVTVTTNNEDAGYASIGDEMTITAAASEGIITKEVTINGQSVESFNLTDRQFYANYLFKNSDSDGIVQFEISFSDSSGNDGEIVKSTTDNSKVVFDKTPPSDFITGLVISDGGSVVADSWNSTNDKLLVNVPIDESDTTLINGVIQVWAKIGSNNWEMIVSPKKIISDDLGKDRTISLKEIIVESIAGFKDEEVIEIRSILIDRSGNITEGGLTENKIIIDQTLPVISRMTIESSNGYPSKAKVGDEVTIRFQADEKIKDPTFTIYGKETKAENKEAFIWTVGHLIEATDPEGKIKFSYTPIIDIHGNPAIPTIKKDGGTIIDTTLAFENGDQFVGKWRYGNINGFGHYTWQEIGTYKGKWLDGKKHGQGTMVWNDGSKYEGEWALDEFNGEGTYYYANGDIYKGSWKNGKKFGQGILTWKSGDVYEGQWIDGKRSGRGVMTLRNGEKWAVKVLDFSN